MSDHSASWHFLTNHAHVLLSIAEDTDITVRDLAHRVGITERAVIRIIGELDEEGFLDRERHGRNNHYTVHPDLSLRHPVEAHCTVGDLIEMVQSAGARTPSS